LCDILALSTKNLPQQAETDILCLILCLQSQNINSKCEFPAHCGF